MSIDPNIDEESLIAEDIHAFLDRNQQKELLRFCGVEVFTVFLFFNVFFFFVFVFVSP